VKKLLILLLTSSSLALNAQSPKVVEWLSAFDERQDTALLRAALDYSTGQGDWQSIGAIHRVWGRFDDGEGRSSNAISHFQQALSAFQKADDAGGLMKVNLNLGFLYFHLLELELALNYTEEALRWSRATGDLQAQAIILGNLGSMYGHQEGQHQKALDTHLEALRLYRQLEDTIGILSAYNNIGVIYDKTGDYSQAASNYAEALELAKSVGDQAEACRIMSNLASLEMKRRNPRQGLRYLEDAGPFCADAEIQLRLYHTKLYAEAYEQAGRTREALEILNRYIVLNDSFYDLERIRAVRELTTQYETEQKQQQIALLEVEGELREKELRQQKLVQRGLLGGIVGLAVFAVVFLLQRNRLAREQQRSEDLLLNILPADVAAELKQNGYAQARQFEQTSVLFTDFVNFSEHAEKMPPQELVNELDLCFKAFDEIIERHGLEKIKTIGDAYLAVSGLPVPLDDHAERACRAALDIRRFVQERLAQGGVFHIRIGIHSGPLIAGIVGVRKYAYDVWGDSVNLAARMEQHGEPGCINISRSTWELVQGRFVCTYRGQLEAKGKGKLDMYFLD
jgi:adenylate cyclase